MCSGSLDGSGWEVGVSGSGADTAGSSVVVALVSGGAGGREVTGGVTGRVTSGAELGACVWLCSVWTVGSGVLSSGTVGKEAASVLGTELSGCSGSETKRPLVADSTG